MAKEMWLDREDGVIFDIKPVLDILGNDRSEWHKVVYLDDDEYKDYMDVCDKYRAWQDNLKERMNAGL